ncbi:hypothetical protein EDC65_3367 [Stella humosa]|uniref:Uncharacterized protein n=1 Tax=Stella humosa TaxID=94 RepID=A0A3N1KX16_9PROT|nr:hypothetical protein [Stella humosa]ROP84022.1 hypothetical protein EDC65_3367 [Stella humosa]BBK33531.1 hypothetical protein STHU_41650 [Stella humosa]
MPIVERDPWRLQYFTDVPCPDDIVIPTDDGDAWRLFPAHRHVYDKLHVALSQGLDCAPHGIEPSAWPVFSKPIVNLRGMGTGSRVMRSPADYARHQQPGHMWMTRLSGEHVSTDVAVAGGRARWWRHTVGHARAGGTFDRWTIEAGRRPELEAYCGAWLARHLADYSGIVNFETIGGRIIEAHLRFSDQWPDLYGPGWVAALVELYAERRWRFADDDRRDGHSVVLFAPHGRRYTAPPATLQAEIRAMPGVSSLQITFDPARAPALHAMPPGGFRLAIVNCWSLAAGRAARRRLAAAFGLLPPKQPG